MDVAWSAPCIDGRCYDYTGLGSASDFLFVMAYDMRSQIYDLTDCIASANSPVARVADGLTNFTQVFQVPSSKLVLGGMLLIISLLYSQTRFFFSVPWYCYDYKCLSIDTNMTCVCVNLSFLFLFHYSFLSIANRTCSFSWCSLFRCCWFSI